MDKVDNSLWLLFLTFYSQQRKVNIADSLGKSSLCRLWQERNMSFSGIITNNKKVFPSCRNLQNELSQRNLRYSPSTSGNPGYKAILASPWCCILTNSDIAPPGLSARFSSTSRWGRMYPNTFVKGWHRHMHVTIDDSADSVPTDNILPYHALIEERLGATQETISELPVLFYLLF